MGDATEESRRGAKAALVEAFSTFGGEALRDVWLFDRDDHESMYLRDDVAEKVADLDVERFVDNERYGYVTRQTYGDLYYTSYEYTVRGFDGYEQFRTFLAEDDRKVGVFASFDRRDGGYDFARLYADVETVVADHPDAAFAPDGE
ncbi:MULTISPECIES: DUF7522 family protein [Halorussus]|uniref:DUF7522 family protein n=1 Tax=Halorussus TaxID=1070314 RepID=UPI0020A0071D|nr:hypothetical protein [Halorussus vallis]USZ75967.1 hypothetical protein NGM07_01275 [Halorussus vallis]